LSDLKIRVSILKSNRRSLRQQVENAQARVAATERAGVDPQPIDLESIKLLKREIESTDDKITTREAQITEMTALYQRDIDRFEQLQDVVRLRHQLETPTQ
jgi:ribosomal protein S18